MKTLLTLLVLAGAFSVKAVSFSWGSDGKISFGGTVLNTTGNTATAYLVYLGSDGALSFGDDVSGTLANITDQNVGTATTKTAGSAAAKGTFLTTYDAPLGNQNYSYGVVMTYVKDGTTYYNISSDVYTVPSDALDNATGLKGTFGFSFADGGEVTKLTAAQVGQGWFSIGEQQEPITPEVPEPATGALALAGVALLFKRRRA